MMDIRTLTPIEQAKLMNALEVALDSGRRFRISQDSDGIKWKVGEGMWTPGYGTNDNAVAEHSRYCEAYGHDAASHIDMCRVSAR
jgi:hypothetical protein